MARITVEDCIDKIPNKFELIVLGAMRARELASGQKAALARDGDKNTVIALREIAASVVSVPDLRERMVEGMRSPVKAQIGGHEASDIADLSEVVITEDASEDDDKSSEGHED